MGSGVVFGILVFVVGGRVFCRVAGLRGDFLGGNRVCVRLWADHSDLERALVVGITEHVRLAARYHGDLFWLDESELVGASWVWFWRRGGVYDDLVRFNVWLSGDFFVVGGVGEFSMSDPAFLDSLVGFLAGY